MGMQSPHSEAELLERIDSLEDELDEQGFAMEKLRFQLAHLREEMDATFSAIASDIQYLQDNKKDDICA